jgi:predicted O-methyltransferase YrrM
MYEYATTAAHANMIEVGAAHGAGTISIAKALKENDSSLTLYTFEGQQAQGRFGSEDSGLTKLYDNLESFDVDDRVRVIPELLTRDSELPDVINNNQPYSLLCIDADGDLKRDFDLFYDLLLPNAVIIIDDYSLDGRLSTAKKRYQTFCYANYFEQQGLIRHEKVVDSTLFATKTMNGTLDDVRETDLRKIEEHLNEEDRRIHGT